MSGSGDVAVSSEGSVRIRPLQRMETLDLEENNSADTATPARSRASARKFKGYSNTAIGIAILMLATIASILSIFAYHVITSEAPGNATLHPLADLAFHYGNVLNTSENACDDMYGVACHRTVKKFESAQQAAMDVPTEARQKALKHLPEFLQKPPLLNDTETSAKLKVFFKACVQEKDVTGDISRIEHLIEKAGGWTLFGEKFGKKARTVPSEGWLDVVEKLNRAEVSTFFPFRLSSRPHPVFRGRMAILLKPFLHDQTELLPAQGYSKLIRTIMSVIETNEDQLAKEWSRCVKFESELYKRIAFKREDFHSYTLAGLEATFPNFAWAEFFNKAFVDTKKNVEQNEIIWIQNPNLLRPVDRLLRETPVSVIRNYLMYRTLQSHMRFESSELSEKPYANKSRSEKCTNLLVDKASILTGKIYVDNFVTKMAKSDAQSIFMNIQSAALDYFRGISWLDVFARNDVLSQLKNIRSVAAFSDGSSMYIEKLNYDLKFQHGANFYDLYWNLSRFDRKFTYGQSIMSAEDHHYATLLTSAVDAEVYLYEATSTLYIPAVMLQEPHYAISRPKYLTYAGLGVAIAREILRSLRISNLCENSTFCPRYEFESRKSCLVDLYGSYTIQQIGRKVDGLKTFDENLSDNLAWKITYQASYNTWQAKYLLPETTIPGYIFSQTQWFWIEAATAECQHIDDNFLRRYLVLSSRSPAQAKINAGMSSLKEFGTAFNCTVDSRAKKLRHCEY